jgi:hypothetical protein
MVSVETISIVFTGLSVSLAAFYYINTLRNANRMRELTLESQELTCKAQEQALETRQAQFFMSVYRDHVSKENISDWIEMVMQWESDDYDEFVEKYNVPSSLENHSKYGTLTGRLEGLGVLVRRGLIDVNLLYDLNYGSIIMIWEKFSPIIMEMRRRMNVPQFMADLEYLYDEMVRIREERAHLTIL